MSTAGKILARPGAIASSLVRRATSGGVRRHASNLKPANQVGISSYVTAICEIQYVTLLPLSLRFGEVGHSLSRTTMYSIRALHHDVPPLLQLDQ